PLRKKEDPRVPRRANLAPSERPDPGDGTDQCALARARGATEEHRVAARDGQVHVRHERLAIRTMEIDALHRHVRAPALRAPDAAAARHLETHALERALEPGEPF